MKIARPVACTPPTVPTRRVAPYTDGSLDKGIASAAFAFRNKDGSFRTQGDILGQRLDIATAEVEAVIMAVRDAAARNVKRITIFADSQAALLRISSDR